MRGPQAMMRTPLMIESPSRPGTDQRDLARRRLASAELWSSVNRRPSIHSADTQVQTGPACEWSGATGRDSVVSSPLREPRGTGVRTRMVTSSCRPYLPWSRSLEPYRASWRSGSNPSCPDLNPSSPRSELNDLLPHLGRTELAVILGASAIWQGGEGPGPEALLGRAAGQARGSAFERRHSTAGFG